MSFLLDTDICSAYLKGDRRVADRCTQFLGRLFVSIVSVAELYAWALRPTAPRRRRQGLDDFLSERQILAVDRVVAERFGEIRGAQLQIGWCTPPMDLLIAATAISHDLTLVTHNVKDFANVPHFVRRRLDRIFVG